MEKNKKDIETLCTSESVCSKATMTLGKTFGTSNLILGLTAGISLWVITTQQQHLEKLKWNMRGELDKRAVPLQAPFKTILLSHKEQRRSRGKRKFITKSFGGRWTVTSQSSTMALDHTFTLKALQRANVPWRIPTEVMGVFEWQNPHCFITLSTFYWHTTLFPVLDSGAYLPQPLTGIAIMTEISCRTAPLAALEHQQSINCLLNHHFYLVHS